MTNKLNILSWNIQSRDGLNGNKLHDAEFCKLLEASDIFCLQECRKPVKIPKFICLNKQRPNKNGGGVTIGHSRRLAGGIQEYKLVNKTDMLAITLNKSFFSLKKDILLINCYIPPQGSKYLKNSGLQPFEELNSILTDTSDKYDIIICGDFNSRTQTINDCLLCHNIPGIDMSSDSDNTDQIIPTRNNKDLHQNGYTKSFMDLLTQADLLIANGRCLGDIYGELTCFHYNGESTVDYFLLNKQLLTNVVLMKVQPLTEFSDHRPINLLLVTQTANYPELTNFSFEPAPEKYKWDKNSSTSFTQSQYQDNINQLIVELLQHEVTSSDGVHDYNKKLTNIIHTIADASLEKTKNKTTNFKNNHKWFDRECRVAKRSMNSTLRQLNKCINDLRLKNDYLNARKNYRSILKTKKSKFFANLNEEIELSKRGSINWTIFKKLKDTSQESTLFDDFDIDTFYKFFQHLYTNSSPIDANQRSTLRTETDNFINGQSTTEFLSDLNKNITLEEVKNTIKRLSNGKSVSLDVISNEMLKHLTSKPLQALIQLFNYCLEYNVYPWMTSTITPLLKGGDPYNPDNYRAIALGSCMSKLFSSILLQRIQVYRLQCCPDHPNQLGFKKGAQTSDHIITLKTVIDKYTIKHKRKLFSCFVDFKKAFDSVARDALLYKVAKMGIGGRVFKVLKNMYDNTSARIKLIRKLSEHIKLENGVEQGHPLSPELFKIFIHDLSSELNEIIAHTPELNNISISHLFWADDLVLLSLSESTLQKLVDILERYCKLWGLTINIKKTKIMIFNKSGRLISPINDIILNGVPIEVTQTYCYLGIVFVPSGKFKIASDELRKKALRSFFKLKSAVSRENLSVTALFKLFDALVLPVLSYGCQVLLPDSRFVAQITKPATSNNWQQSWLSAISNDNFEKIHLKFIKWVLGVHKKASNIGCWGDTGRIPLGVTLTKQFYKYVLKVSTNDNLSLLYHTYIEQKSLNLPWYQTFCKIDKAFSPTISKTLLETPYPLLSLQSGITNMFTAIWKGALDKSQKLDFLAEIKAKWGQEQYIRCLSFSLRKNITRIRISAHRLPIEIGRYNKPPIPRDQRFCPYCFDKNIDHPKTIGNEHHLLFDCLTNAEARNKTNMEVMSLIMSKDAKSLFSLKGNSLTSFALYLKMSYTEYLNYTTVDK